MTHKRRYYSSERYIKNPLATKRTATIKKYASVSNGIPLRCARTWEEWTGGRRSTIQNKVIFPSHKAANKCQLALQRLGYDSQDVYSCKDHFHLTTMKAE